MNECGSRLAGTGVAAGRRRPDRAFRGTGSWWGGTGLLVGVCGGEDAALHGGELVRAGTTSGACFSVRCALAPGLLRHPRGGGPQTPANNRRLGTTGSARSRVVEGSPPQTSQFTGLGGRPGAFVGVLGLGDGLHSVLQRGVCGAADDGVGPLVARSWFGWVAVWPSRVRGVDKRRSDVRKSPGWGDPHIRIGRRRMWPPSRLGRPRPSRGELGYVAVVRRPQGGLVLARAPAAEHLRWRRVRP